MTIYMTRMRCLSKSDYLSTNWSNGQVQKISIPNHGRLPCFNPPPPLCLRKFQNALPPPMPSEFYNHDPPPSPSEFPGFLKHIFDLAMPIWTNEHEFMPPQDCDLGGARWQALLFSDKKNLPLVARLCKLLFKSEFGYKHKHHLR